jgi:hypothetical protein
MGKDTRLAELTQAKIGQFCVSSIPLTHHLHKILNRLFHQESGKLFFVVMNVGLNLLYNAFVNIICRVCGFYKSRSIDCGNYMLFYYSPLSLSPFPLEGVREVAVPQSVSAPIGEKCPKDKGPPLVLRTSGV